MTLILKYILVNYMPINVFGNSSPSYDNGNKIDTSSFVQKAYLSSKYIEIEIKEDFDL